MTVHYLVSAWLFRLIFCHPSTKLDVPDVPKVFSSPNLVCSLCLVDIFLEYSCPPIFYAWITPTGPQVSTYTLCSPYDALPDIPSLSQDSVGSCFMCIHNTLHSIYYNITVYFHYLSIFSLKDYIHYGRTPALFPIVSPVTNGAWRVIDTQNQFPKLTKEMNWHTRTRIILYNLISTRLELFFLCSVTRATLKICFYLWLDLKIYF